MEAEKESFVSAVFNGHFREPCFKVTLRCTNNPILHAIDPRIVLILLPGRTFNQIRRVITSLVHSFTNVSDEFGATPVELLVVLQWDGRFRTQPVVKYNRTGYVFKRKPAFFPQFFLVDLLRIGVIYKIFLERDGRLDHQTEAKVVVAHPILLGAVVTFKPPIIIPRFFLVEGVWIVRVFGIELFKFDFPCEELELSSLVEYFLGHSINRHIILICDLQVLPIKLLFLCQF